MLLGRHPMRNDLRWYGQSIDGGHLVTPAPAQPQAPTRGPGQMKLGDRLDCGLGVADIGSRGGTVALSTKDVETWYRAANALRTAAELGKPAPKLKDQLLIDKVDNFKPDASSSLVNKLNTTYGDLIAFLALILLSTLYGGLHLSAWNFEFPSRVEQMMWRISGLIIAFYPLVVWAAMSLSDLIEKHNIDWDTLNICGIGGWILLAFFALGILYIGGRLFIVVEAFISIRKLPLGVYVTVDWAKYIPHL
jgi:hypothetical protein